VLRQLKVLRRGGRRSCSPRRIGPSSRRRPWFCPGAGGGASWSARTRWPDCTGISSREAGGARAGPIAPPLDPSIRHLIPSDGQGEPPVRLPQDPREAPEAQGLRLGHDHRNGAQTGRTRPGATSDRAHLDAVSAAPGHAALSSDPHSEEEGLQDLEPHRERQMPAPVKEDPTADTRIHRSEGPSVPRRHPGARAAPVGPPPAS
jgi:hypothetical protein